MLTLRRIILGIALVTAAAGQARAQGFISPFIGANFGGNAGECADVVDCTSKQFVWGVSAGFLAGGIFGLEGDFGYAPKFFGEGDALEDNYVLTAMANVLVGVPLGPVRPYGAGGFGIIHTDINQSDLLAIDAITNNDFGYNLGGGLFGYFSEHVGVRADLRHFHSLEAFEDFVLDDSDSDDSEHLNFWRAAFGVAFRF